MQCNTVRSIILDHQTLPDMTLAFWACRPRDDRCVTTISWIDAVKSCVRHSSSHRTVGNPKPSSLSLSWLPPQNFGKIKRILGIHKVSVSVYGTKYQHPESRLSLSWRTLHSYMYVWTPRELCNRCLPQKRRGFNGAKWWKWMIWKWQIWCWYDLFGDGWRILCVRTIHDIPKHTTLPILGATGPKPQKKSMKHQVTD